MLPSYFEPNSNANLVNEKEAVVAQETLSDMVTYNNNNDNNYDPQPNNKKIVD